MSNKKKERKNMKSKKPHKEASVLEYFKTDLLSCEELCPSLRELSLTR